jgi:prophage maintenance system killer protein
MAEEQFPRYLSVEDLLTLHKLAMGATGQAPEALRGNDAGALEAAAKRAEWAAHYQGADLIRQAIMLAIGISDAQAFLDGNKRAALVAADEFLDRNDWEFVGDRFEWAVQFKAATAALPQDKSRAIDAFEAWTRQYVRRRSSA